MADKNEFFDIEMTVIMNDGDHHAYSCNRIKASNKAQACAIAILGEMNDVFDDDEHKEAFDELVANYENNPEDMSRDTDSISANIDNIIALTTATVIINNVQKQVLLPSDVNVVSRHNYFS